jgi:hypothetical protein
VVNPAMVEKLLNKRVATVIAGNPYFHPFAWLGIYQFLVEYDAQGRVKTARQLPRTGDSTTHAFEFQWDGWRLMKIVERGTGDYQRQMTYAGGHLAAETVTYHGKNSKIEYKYKGSTLSEAVCGDDASIDGRGRHVTFR